MALTKAQAIANMRARVKAASEFPEVNMAGTPPKPTGNIEKDNIQAFLWLIRVAEGTTGPLGYRTMYTNKIFPIDDPTQPTFQFRDHPRKPNSAYNRITGKTLTSTAAGAYQFLSNTWNNCVRATGVKDFSPASQDRAAMWLVSRHNALNDVKKGNIRSALYKCRTEWASFPNSPHNQPTQSESRLLTAYVKAGGKLA